jgi:hypothetical protein
MNLGVFSLFFEKIKYIFRSFSNSSKQTYFLFRISLYNGLMVKGLFTTMCINLYLRIGAKY